MGLCFLTVPLAFTQPMAQDSIALQKQQLLVHLTGQGGFSASEASCAMPLLVSTQLPNRMAELCQRQTGWCGPLFDHVLHRVQRETTVGSGPNRAPDLAECATALKTQQ